MRLPPRDSFVSGVVCCLAAAHSDDSSRPPGDLLLDGGFINVEDHEVVAGQGQLGQPLTPRQENLGLGGPVDFMQNGVQKVGPFFGPVFWSPLVRRI